MLFEDPEDAGVGDAARETAAERQTDSRRGRGGRPEGLEGRVRQTMYRRSRSASSSHIITGYGASTVYGFGDCQHQLQQS